tara:strand:- start:2329 stop:3138 length:810 start_codon:yes stop_codon:yes gene_type:complete
MEKKRPFLKWAGNKYQCIQHILKALPPSSRLIEPFVGSGSIFLNSCYEHYLLGEQNQDLIHLYQFVQNEQQDFIAYCRQFFNEKNNQESVYYQLRTEFNQTINARHRAALFLYLNRHGYNGLCRYNKKGIYNVPFGRYKKPYFPEKEMLFFANKCQSTEFLIADYKHTFSMAKSGDIIYCDPPYAPLSQQSNFTAYTGIPFGLTEQIKLAELAMESANKGATVVVSNHNTAFTRYHYRYAEIKTFPVKRFINCRGHERKAVSELVATFR